MKKISTIIISIALVLCLMFGSVVSYSATTYYVYGSYTYSVVDKNQLAFCDWDNSSDTLTIPDGIVDDYFVMVADYALQNNSVVKTVDLSHAQHLTKIGTGAFTGCSALETLIIPSWTNELSDYMCQDCTGLINVIIDAEIDKINVQMFNRCSSLEEFVIPSSVTTIEKFAFGNCTSLKKVVIPDSVVDINSTAFKNDEQLIIYCNTDSYAQMYAQNSNIPYILLDGPKSGDANGDGMVDILDSTEIQKYAAESTKFTPEQFELCDINKDGYCDVIDALLVQKYVVGEYDIPPIIYNS